MARKKQQHRLDVDATLRRLKAKANDKAAKLLVEERQHRDKVTAETGVTPEFDRSRLIEIESLHERPLSNKEKMFCRLDGRSEREVMDELRLDGFEPPMPDPGPVDPIDQAIAEASQRLREEKIDAMSPAEKDLFLLQESKREAVLRDAREEADATERQAREPILDSMRSLLTKYSDNLNFGPDDLKAVARAIVALEAPGSDSDATLKLAAEAAMPMARHVAARKEAINGRLAELHGELADLDDAYPQFMERRPEGAPPPSIDDDGPTVAELFAELRSDMHESFGHVVDVGESSDDAS